MVIFHSYVSLPEGMISTISNVFCIILLILHGFGVKPLAALRLELQLLQCQVVAGNLRHLQNQNVHTGKFTEQINQKGSKKHDFT